MINFISLSLPALGALGKLHLCILVFYEKWRRDNALPLFLNIYWVIHYFTEYGSATAQKAGFGLPLPSNNNGELLARQLIISVSPQT